MIVYIDVLFAINFSMDFLSLFLSAHFTKRKIFKKRMLISAIIGGVYSIIDFIYPIKNAVLSITVSILTSIIMCMIAYYEKSIRAFIKIYLIYWAVSLSLGGIMSALYTFLNKILSEYIAGYSYENVYNGARFFVIILLTLIASIVFGKAFSNEKAMKSVQIYVKIGDKEYNIDSLCDSGNLLTEPISGKSVVLVAKNSEIGKQIEEMSEIVKRFIPYSTANGHGLLKGIIPKTIKINEVSKEAIVAPSENDTFGGYEACVPTSLL